MAGRRYRRWRDVSDVIRDPGVEAQSTGRLGAAAGVFFIGDPPRYELEPYLEERVA